MKEYTMHELFRLSRAELMRLDDKTSNALAELPAICEARTIALINQRRIRRELGRREYGLDRGPL